jgi:hypothetical protein
LTYTSEDRLTSWYIATKESKTSRPRKYTTTKSSERAGGGAQMVERLPIKCEFNPSAAKKKRKELRNFNHGTYIPKKP